MELKGIHHVSALTAKAPGNYEFYTKILGLRLIKKTVNQDDVSIYHLFYGDEQGNPGTELTFFEIPMAARTHEGTNSISQVSLRVKSNRAIEYWKMRFEENNVQHGDITSVFGRMALPFKDHEGQRLLLVSDENTLGIAAGTPWGRSPIPSEFAVIGLGPVKLTVARMEETARIMTDILGFRKKGTYPSEGGAERQIAVYETGEGGTGAEVHIEERMDLPPERLGRGGVHHVAFRVKDEQEMQKWIEKVADAGIPNSGFIDRFYFRSLYFREPNGILFELATDGPGFATDEAIEHLGESLALPPFLEPRRQEIEARLKPLDTTPGKEL
ncbi:ring-cleaving dioxygenase [Peribacillus sp. SCS-155]|uniref:ring-cleaving dioxygenase n=1 Tax=Peribacillus sedimenti TaxID=3115297 RepID=UPI0039064E72